MWRGFRRIEGVALGLLLMKGQFSEIYLRGYCFSV